jgi:hypothetical protein
MSVTSVVALKQSGARARSTWRRRVSDRRAHSTRNEYARGIRRWIEQGEDADFGISFDGFSESMRSLQ